MADPSTQQDRQARIKTSLGEDVLVLERFDTIERLSDPFLFTADVRSERGEMDLREELGTAVSVGIYDGDDVVRWFHGVFYEAELIGYDLRAARYRITLRPWFALLDLNRDSRIYQAKSVKDIIQDVFDRAGFSDYDLSKLTKTYPQREYCVQFRESDFAFVSRLMEEEGIYYFFDHQEDKHIFHACEGMVSHDRVAGLEAIKYVAGGHEQGGRFGQIWSWAAKLNFAPGKVTLRDYNFKTPQAPVTGEATRENRHPHDSAELYDYPANAMTNGDAARYADQRLKAASTDRFTFAGEGDCVALTCGARFDLTDHPDRAFDKEYLVVETQHRFLTEAFLSRAIEELSEAYGADTSPMIVSIRAVQGDLYWRPERLTPWPRPAGPQTAVVVGPAGETIYVDEFSRVKVQFPWDRQGKNDDQSSCWMRVSQGWADGGYGIIFIPRIGQ